jgi:ParB family chromosome partitioning protein
MAKKKIPLAIVYLRLEDIVRAGNNARKHPKHQVGQIMAAIKEFGFTNPILIDEDKVIIAGHGRLSAAERLGMTEVPTITLIGLNEKQKRAYAIADNAIPLNSAWDTEILAAELKFLDAQTDINLKELGLDELAPDPIELRDVEIKAPPKVAWALIGVPIARFGKVQPMLDKLADSAILIATTITDDKKDR